MLLDDDGEDVVLVTRFLGHLADSGYSPKTLCAYARLQLEDLAYGRRRVTVRKRDEHPWGARAKARRERVVDLREPRTLEAVSRYVLHERAGEAVSPFVFLVGGAGKTRCEPLSYQALARGFARRLDRLGTRSPGKTPHALRHTHATAMWEGRRAPDRLVRRHASRRRRNPTRLMEDVSQPWK